MFGSVRAISYSCCAKVSGGASFFGYHIDNTRTHLAIFSVKATTFYRDFFYGTQSDIGNGAVVARIAQCNAIDLQ